MKRILVKFLRLQLFVIFLVGICSNVLAQGGTDVIRVDTELAAFEISVTDTNGRPVRHLNPKDLTVFDDGIERSIDFFQPVIKKDGSRPLVVVFALDVSGSMTDAELEKLREAVQNFAGKMPVGDSYFAVISFAMKVKILQDFANRPDRLQRSLQKLDKERDGLSTHAYDAVDQAIRMIERRSPRSIRGRMPKRSVILITDGFPVGDIVRPPTVIERANAALTSVYSIIMPSYSRIRRNSKPVMTPLEASRLTERTGGMNFYAGEDSLAPLFASLAEEITSSYAVAFYPEPAAGTERKFRPVTISSKQGYTIRQNRPGYISGEFGVK